MELTSDSEIDDDEGLRDLLDQESSESSDEIVRDIFLITTQLKTRIWCDVFFFSFYRNQTSTLMKQKKKMKR